MASAFFPDSASPHMALTAPTQAESITIGEATHRSWGGALDLQTYLDREAYLLAEPLADGGRIVPWILTDASVPTGQRPVLSSCETLRFRALLRTKDGAVREGWAHGVASVYTFDDRRGRGYAARMMKILAQTLAKMEQDQPSSALFSVLFSDVGKEFYNRAGWAPFQSTHLRLPAQPGPASPPAAVQAVTADNLRELVDRDNEIIRARLFAPGEASDKIRVAIAPDYDSYLRHQRREQFVCERVFKRTPTVHGAVYTAEGGSRVWAVWTRGISGGLEKPDANTLYILRLAVEDEAIPDAQLEDALAAVLAAAQGQAAEWSCPNVHLWNPDPRVRQLAEAVPELGASFVVRESKSITCLQQFGGRETSETEWVLNEKFEWC
jgi:GNAT superfamily N-acetyltransferase